jgi:DNA-directed RNA polymerase subunit RPC12/RpoP/predicted GIY-YIG superfamily endonuclease
MEADGWDPRLVSAKSNKKMRWRCSRGHSWTVSVNNRSKGNGCPYCANKKLLKGFNDVATTHPEIAAQAHRWNPAAVIAGSNMQRTWRCSKGHLWQASSNTRTQGHGCPYCSHHKVSAGFNDLATTHPEIAAQAHRWNPATVTAGSSLRKLEWRCPKGHIFAMTPKVRTTQEQNCPFCAGKQVLKGFNDLATTHPEIAAQAHRWNPATVTAGSNKHCSWKCEEGHVWSASPNKRSSGRGCPTCASSGFDQRKKGWIYLVLDDDRGLLQIGISNTPEARLKTHERNGFDVVLDIRGPQDGLRVRELEGLIIKALKRRGAIFAKSAKLARFDGYTESWLKTSLNVEKIARILTWVHADENEARGTRLAASGKPQGT